APPERFERLLVPVEGSSFSRFAAEFAFAYAAAVGARVTVLHVLNEARVLTGALTIPESRSAHAVDESQEETLAARIRADYGTVADAATVEWDVRVLASGDPAGTIIEQSDS